jgi:hypothetical protein
MDPGPGVSVLVQGTPMYVDGNERLRVPASGAGSWLTQGFREQDGVTRLSGQGLYCKITVDALADLAFGFATVAALLDPQAAGNSGGAIWLRSSNSIDVSEGAEVVTGVGIYTAATPHEWMVINRLSGYFAAVKGGFYTNWTLIWVGQTDATATLYGGVNSFDADLTLDNFRIPGIVNMTTLASDSFDRANSADLGTTDGDGAAESGGSGKTWVEQVGTWEIASNRIRLQASDLVRSQTAVVDCGETDVVLQAVVNRGTAQFVGVALRYDVAETGLEVTLDGTAGNFEIYENVAGTRNQRASKAVAIAPSTDYDVQVHTFGNDIWAWLNGANKVDYSNPAVNNGATSHGVWTFGSGGSPGQSQADDFVVWPRFPAIPDYPPFPDPDYTFAVHDSFITAEAGPVASPRVCEYGPGELTFIVLCRFVPAVALHGPEYAGLRRSGIRHQTGIEDSRQVSLGGRASGRRQRLPTPRILRRPGLGAGQHQFAPTDFHGARQSDLGDRFSRQPAGRGAVHSRPALLDGYRLARRGMPSANQGRRLFAMDDALRERSGFGRELIRRSLEFQRDGTGRQRASSRQPLDSDAAS